MSTSKIVTSLKILLTQIPEKITRETFRKALNKAIKENDGEKIKKILFEVSKYINAEEEENKPKEKVKKEDKPLTFDEAVTEFLATLCPDIMNLPNLSEYYSIVEKEIFPYTEEADRKKIEKQKKNVKREKVFIDTMVKKDTIVVSADPQLGKSKLTIGLAIKSMLEHKTPVIIPRALKSDGNKFVHDILDTVKPFNDFLNSKGIKDKRFEISVIEASKLDTKREEKKLIKSINQTSLKIVVCLGNDSQLSKVKSIIEDHPSSYNLLIDEADYIDYGSDSKTSKTLSEMKPNSYQNFLVSATPFDILFSEKELKAANNLRMKRPEDYRGFIDFAVVLLETDPQATGISKPATYKQMLKLDGNLKPFLSEFSKCKPDYSWNKKKYYPRICLVKVTQIVDNHDNLFHGIVKKYGSRVITVAYNGEGIKMDYEGMEEINIGEIKIKPDTYVEIDIPHVLQYFKDNGGVKKFPRFVIISGKLASRCVSYVSSDYDWHLTDMYYNPAAKTPIPEMIQSAGRLCGRNRGRSPFLKLHCTKVVADALYNGFHFTNELIDRAIASPLITDGEEGAFYESLKNIVMHKKKFPKGRRITNKIKVNQGEFNLIKKGDDGGKKLEEYKAPVLEEEESDSEEEEVEEVNEEQEVTGFMIVKPSVGTKKFQVYQVVMEYLKKNRKQWISQATIRNLPEMIKIFVGGVVNIKLAVGTEDMEYGSKGLLCRKTNTSVEYYLA